MEAGLGRQALTRGEVQEWGKAVGRSTGFFGYFAAVAGACVAELLAGTFGDGKFGTPDVVGIILGVVVYMIIAAMVCHPHGRTWRMESAGTAAASVAGGAAAGFGGFVMMMVLMISALAVAGMWVLSTTILIIVIVI